MTRGEDDNVRKAFVGNAYFTVEWIDRDGGRIQVTTAARTFNFPGAERDMIFMRRMLAAVIATAFRRSAEQISDWANEYD